MSRASAARTLRDWHAETIRRVLDLPSGAVKDHATAEILDPLAIMRDRDKREVGYSPSLDQQVRRSLGEGPDGRRGGIDLDMAAARAIQARSILVLAPWHNGSPWLRDRSDDNPTESKAMASYLAEAKKARARIREDLATLLESKKQGQTYGPVLPLPPVPPRRDLDGPEDDEPEPGSNG